MQVRAARYLCGVEKSVGEFVGKKKLFIESCYCGKQHASADAGITIILRRQLESTHYNSVDCFC